MNIKHVLKKQILMAVFGQIMILLRKAFLVVVTLMNTKELHHFGVYPLKP